MKSGKTADGVEYIWWTDTIMFYDYNTYRFSR